MPLRKYKQNVAALTGGSSPPPGPWLLTGGVWADSGSWVDSANWID